MSETTDDTELDCAAAAAAADDDDDDDTCTGI